MYHLGFTVDELPKTPNSLLGSHWRTRMLQRDRWLTWVMGKVSGKKPPAPLKRAHLKLTRHSALRPDPSGLVGSFKYVEDALVANGILADDSSDQIGIPDYCWEYASPRKGFITVEVTELDAR